MNPASSWVRCACCGKYIPFGGSAIASVAVGTPDFPLWIDGKPYCHPCARLKVTEALRGKGEARSGHEA